MPLSSLVKVVNPTSNVSTPTQPTPTQNTAPRNYTKRTPTSKPIETPQPTYQKPTPPVITHVNETSSLFVEGLPNGGRELRKVELWFGGPGAGKTTFAFKIAQQLKESGKIEDYIATKCHEEMTVMSTLKTAKTNDEGQWLFKFNKLFNALTDPLKKTYLSIMDEFNTMPMSVMKAFQPWFDDTTGTVDFEDMVYEKNPNVYFIFTLNHEDIGIQRIPHAVLDRAFPEEFESLTVEELSRRSGVPVSFIDLLSRIYKMFGHLGDVIEFNKSVRKLKNMRGLTKEQFKKYITSELSLAHVEWQEAVAISPEFQNLIEEYGKIKW